MSRTGSVTKIFDGDDYIEGAHHGIDMDPDTTICSHEAQLR
jgi:hypothetical protein